MATTINNKLNELSQISVLFDKESNIKKNKLIIELSTFKNFTPLTLLNYHNILLFIITHCNNENQRVLIENEFGRIAALIKRNQWQNETVLLDSGLPYTFMLTRFSCDAFLYLMKNKYIQLELYSLENEQFGINDLLSLTLPELFAEETTLAYEKDVLLKRFGVKNKCDLHFIIHQIQNMKASHLVKDYLWQLLCPFIYISSKSKEYSKTYNQLSFATFYDQIDLFKNFNQNELLSKKLPSELKLNKKDKDHLIQTIKNSMLLTMRETDTSIYMDENTLHYFELERGYSIAIYGMEVDRQLPMQSYIGFNLFKNGYTLAYGGSWIFGRHAMFGLNLFPEFRGGESGYLMCQILRTYIQLFQLTYIEVDSYMFGNGNADGIKSAAYWFYYKHGFRSIETSIRKIAESEQQKKLHNKNHRTKEKTLLQLAQCNMALNLGHDIPISRLEQREVILKMVEKYYKGDIQGAMNNCIKEWCLKANIKSSSIIETKAFKEMAMWIKAFQIKDKRRLDIALNMVTSKYNDPIEYNKQLMDFLDFKQT